MPEEPHKARAQRWLRRFTDQLSPDAQKALTVLRTMDRLQPTTDEDRRRRDAGARDLLDALSPEEAVAVELAWRLGPYAPDLSRSPVAEDVEELGTFAAEVAEEDRPRVARILGNHEAHTVDEARADLRMRREAGQE